MTQPQTQPRPTADQLEELQKAADDARERVSTYSDEERADLETQARSQILRRRARTTPEVCRT